MEIFGIHICFHCVIEWTIALKDNFNYMITYSQNFIKEKSNANADSKRIY